MRVERLRGRDYIKADYIAGAAFHYDALDGKSLDELVQEHGDDYAPTVRFGAYDDDGVLVATTLFPELPRYVFGKPVNMAGVGGVATMAHARQGGAIRDIFKEAYRWMYDNDQVLSTLYPFSSAFYRKFGYESIHIRGKWTFDLWDMELRVPAPEGRWHMIGHFDHDDATNEALVTRFIEAAEAAESQYPLGGKRPGDVWKKALLDKTMKDGNHFALVFTDPADRTLAALSYRTGDDYFEMDRMGWTEPAGIVAILHYLKGVSGERGKFLAMLPDDLPIELYVKEHSSDAVSHQMKQGAMMTVVHCKGFLEHMAAYADEIWHELGTEPITLAIYDPNEPRNTGYYVVAPGDPVRFEAVDAQGEQDLALKLGAQGKHPDLYCTPAALGMLFMGLRPAWALRDAGYIDYADKTAQRWNRIRPHSAWMMDQF